MLRKVLVGSFLGLMAASSLAQAAATSVQDFFSFDKVAAVELSPDGKYLALVVADPKTGEDGKQLVIMTADSSHKVTASFGVTNYQRIGEIWWTLKDRILASTTRTDTGIMENPLWDGSIYAINADGTQQLRLMPQEFATQKLLGGPAHDAVTVFFFGGLHMHSDDPQHVVVYGGTYGLDHSYHSVAAAYELDVYSGKTRLILDSPLQDGRLVTDDDGAIRLATGEEPKSGEPQLLYRTGDDSHDWKDFGSLYSSDDPAYPDLGTYGLTPDGKGLYWLGHTPTSTLGLYSADLTSSKLTEIYSDPDVDVDDVVWSFDWQKPRKIIAVDTMPGFPAVHIVDEDDPKAQVLASLYQAFEGQEVEITSNTRDGMQMVVKVTSDKDPGEYYLFNAKTGQAAFLFSAKPEIDPKQMADMRPIDFMSRDGVKIHGYLTLPAGSDGKNLPMIINPHGGPHGIRDEWGWDPEVQFFANHGYAVLQVNYRGSGGYGMKFQDLGYGHWADTMQDDLADAVRWVEQQGFVDPKRVCIYGASYGGYAALENGERNPQLYKCIVGYVGLYDMRTMNDSDFSHYASGKHYIGAVAGRDDASLLADSPLSGVDKLQVPVFIAYGGQDHRVVPKNAEEMMAAMDKAGKPYEKYYDPMGYHGFADPEQRYALYTQMLAFFDKYIGPNAAKPATTTGK